MAKNPKNDAVGDTLSPPLRCNAEALHSAPDQALRMQANAAPKPQLLSKTASAASYLRNKAAAASAPGSCLQTLWFSFFFDGTGNNMDADEGTAKHSNVARLYRVHPEDDPDTGTYRIYIPGVGTYFSEVGDPGGTTRGKGMGDKGVERLEWALAQFDAKMKAHMARAYNPSNAIVEINISAFGFSRGAALARAFIHNFVAKRCKQDAKDQWRLADGGYKIRIRFMGLFDTVASVGMPMSANTTSLVGTVASSVEYMIKARLNDASGYETRPQRLAFGKNAQPGADPAPGKYNGHMGWGGDMQIPAMVEAVQHFVAAHEIRNSFPLDSVSVLEGNSMTKPDHFVEVVYPGVHSDVGGSYRPGEGAKSEISEQKLGLIPLADMYQRAVGKGVPLLPKTAWKKLNVDDFKVDAGLLQIYSYYLGKVPSAAQSLGDLFNAHMALYYAWRFRAIRQKEKGDQREAKLIQKNDVMFSNEKKQLDNEIAPLEAQNDAALAELARAQIKRDLYSRDLNNDRSWLPELDDKVDAALREQTVTQDALLRAKAKRDALPSTGSLQSMITMYDAQLLADARAIERACNFVLPGRSKLDPAIRANLRPHYKGLLAAYTNEYVLGQGLTDEKIIAFFDNHVHDSLAGFAQDATLPSDPRVIYLGGDEKYKYAGIQLQEHSPLSINEPTLA